MISDLPAPLLTLLVKHDAPQQAVPTTTNAVANTKGGDTLRTLVNAGRAQGLSRDFIADAIDRRIRAYIAKVGNRGEGDRDNTAYRIARWLTNDFGVSESVALAYLAEWNSGNTPPLSDRQLKLKMISARRSGRRAAGCAHDSRGSAA